MPKRRLILSLACALLVLLGSAAVMAPTKTFATTGPSTYLSPARYQVPMKVAQQFVGRYQMRSVARGALIKTAAMGIEVNSAHFLYGVAQFSGYEEGFQSIWIATLYNFHQTKSRVMIVDIDAQTGGTLLGRLFLTRSSSGDLAGQIELASGRFAIAWHKVPK
jgi:hypothetical protein